MKCKKQGQTDEAIELFRKASAIDPSWSVPHFNLGLEFKQRREWQKSLMHNRRATETDPKNEAAWWNLGIAATALGRWGIARRAWRGFGIEVPNGEGPIDLPCGECPIRLHPDGEAEVVWANRLDPARACLTNIPFPESNHRWKDVVLNDGAPCGYRKHGEREVPVFNAIQLLEASPYGTYVARIQLPNDPHCIAKLSETAARLGGSAEDWSTSVRMLCKACSEGRPHATHDTQAAPPDGIHLVGIAARNREQAEETLRAWQSGLDGVRVESLEEARVP